MTDAEGIDFLRWCLPRLRLAWHGYRLRRIRRRVYRRIEERMRQLALPDVGAYRAHLERDEDEWSVLETLCWIPISRFYRDRAVFEFLERPVLPALSAMAVERGETELRCWSAGCAAGEEPYTVAMIWRLRVASEHDTLIRAALAPLLDRFGGPRVVEVVPGGDHLFADPAARARATAATVAWFTDHLGEPSS